MVSLTLECQLELDVGVVVGAGFADGLEGAVEFDGASPDVAATDCATGAADRPAPAEARHRTTVDTAWTTQITHIPERYRTLCSAPTRQF